MRTKPSFASTKDANAYHFSKLRMPVVAVVEKIGNIVHPFEKFLCFPVDIEHVQDCKLAQMQNARIQFFVPGGESIHGVG